MASLTVKISFIIMATTHICSSSILNTKAAANHYPVLDHNHTCYVPEGGIMNTGDSTHCVLPVGCNRNTNTCPHHDHYTNAAAAAPTMMPIATQHMVTYQRKWPPNISCSSIPNPWRLAPMMKSSWSTPWSWKIDSLVPPAKTFLPWMKFVFYQWVLKFPVHFFSRGQFFNDLLLVFQCFYFRWHLTMIFFL